MANLKGSRTEKNLMLAFAGESQARNRYSYYASKAKKEGFEQIAAVFIETANQESEHAKRFYMFLDSGEVEVTAVFPAAGVGSTAENLLAAAQGEEHEHSDMYPGFAKIAREEGFEAIAKTFEAISIAERNHERRYRTLLKSVENNHVFKRAMSVIWRCRNCGYTHEGPDAPAHCNACAHPQAYFEAMGDVL